MNRDRLARLAALLDRVQAEGRGFDLDTWDCGTTACACGWAGRDRTFQSEGFDLQITGAARRLQPTFEGYVGFTAVERFFGLSWRESERLFCSISYKGDASAADVAARVRELLATGDAS